VKLLAIWHKIVLSIHAKKSQKLKANEAVLFTHDGKEIKKTTHRTRGQARESQRVPLEFPLDKVRSTRGRCKLDGGRGWQERAEMRAEVRGGTRAELGPVHGGAEQGKDQEDEDGEGEGAHGQG